MNKREQREAWDKYLSRKYGDKALFTLAEACEIIGCSMPSIYGMMDDGILDKRRVMTSPRITRLSILDYLANKPAPKVPAVQTWPHQGTLF